MTKHQTKSKETKHNFFPKKLKKKENGFSIAYYIFYHFSWWFMLLSSNQFINIHEVSPSVSKYLSCNEDETLELRKD